MRTAGASAPGKTSSTGLHNPSVKLAGSSSQIQREQQRWIRKSQGSTTIPLVQRAMVDRQTDEQTDRQPHLTFSLLAYSSRPPSSSPPFRPPVPPFLSSARAGSPESPFAQPWSRIAPSSPCHRPSDSAPPSRATNATTAAGDVAPPGAPRHLRQHGKGARSGQSPPRR